MATNVSDRNGRALEYKLADTLSHEANFTLTSQAIAHNIRDYPKFQALPANLQTSYATASNKITSWIKQGISATTLATLDRLVDDPNSVADLVITTNTTTLQISLKHNHQALKHPRPYSFAQYCGYSLGSMQDIQHRQLIKVVANTFRRNTVGNSLFNQCASNDIDALYLGVCNACATSLNSWIGVDRNVARNIFMFLVSTGFYKVIVETRSGVVVKIQDYFSIPSPSAVTCSVSGNRLILTFNNGWEINSRIHTASSRISATGTQLDLKYDAQRTQGTVIENII
jgi:hypothetical protein